MDNNKEKKSLGLAIKPVFNKRGFKIKIFNKKNYYVQYPAGIFEKYSDKNFLTDNFIYARTVTLSIAQNKALHYHTGRPFLKDFIDWGIKQDFGRLSDKTNISSKELRRRFLEKKITFENKPISKLNKTNNHSAKNAVLALSFGKDSLLTYGLIKEIGLNYYLSSDLDEQNFTPNQWRRRLKIINLFKRREKENLLCFHDNVDTLHFNKEDIAKPIEELENTNGMLSFALELMPIAYKVKAKYIIFGNERDVSEYYFNSAGDKSYMAFDQSQIYTKKLNQSLARAGGEIRIASLIEPLYNLAEIKILNSRYPHLLKYIMSCYPNAASPNHWCHHCPICAEMFLLLAAVGGNPTDVGLTGNLFTRKEKEYYSLFDKKISRTNGKSDVEKGELLAFLLAYRQGWRGYLIDLFKEKYLKEAVRREKELRCRVFGIHESVNLPHEYGGKILKIFKQELNNLS